jgi:hypothetical protein
MMANRKQNPMAPHVSRIKDCHCLRPTGLLLLKVILATGVVLKLAMIVSSPLRRRAAKKVTKTHQRVGLVNKRPM